MIRVLIVDDHPLVRHGFRELMSGEPDIEVCGEAADATEALEQIEKTHPNVMVVDITLKGGMNGIELIKRIKVQHKHVQVLVSSMHDDAIYGERALRAGALGYINKEQNPENLIEAVRSVAAGKICVGPELTSRLLHRAVGGSDEVISSPVERLSDRELEVFERIGQGMTTREIAVQLELSMKTVETYREHIKEKLNLKNSAELSRHAVQWVMGKAAGNPDEPANSA
jgi:DNA-binding NarL/FixJ family response regulator